MKFVFEHSTCHKIAKCIEKLIKVCYYWEVDDFIDFLRSSRMILSRPFHFLSNRTWFIFKLFLRCIKINFFCNRKSQKEKLYENWKSSQWNIEIFTVSSDDVAQHWEIFDAIYHHVEASATAGVTKSRMKLHKIVDLYFVKQTIKFEKQMTNGID